MTRTISLFSLVLSLLMFGKQSNAAAAPAAPLDVLGGPPGGPPIPNHDEAAASDNQKLADFIARHRGPDLFGQLLEKLGDFSAANIFDFRGSGLSYEEIVCLLGNASDWFTDVHVIYDADRSYRGSLREGLAHGKGTYIGVKDILLYDGQWLLGQKHGHGKLIDQKKNVYVGDFQYDQRHGHGKIRYFSGGSYEGAFAHDRFEGFGRFKYSTEDEYAGFWQKGLPHGRGKMSYATGETYDGDWIAKKRQGEGTFTRRSGEEQRGSWHNNHFLGP